MATTFCFDFGNTRRKLAIFDHENIREVLVLPNDDNDTILELLKKYKPEKSILSSVVDHNKELPDLLAAHTRFHLLDYRTKLSFNTPVGKPETIGADRLALCAAAVHFYPKKNNLIIALGSCVTYNFINQQNEFLGGAISPGMEMRFRSMHDYTAKLPLVKADPDFPLIGYDTRTNMLTGVIMGMVHEINGFIDQYEQKFSNFNVVLTGGDWVHLASHLKNKIFADPELIFKGLYAISEVNNT